MSYKPVTLQEKEADKNCKEFYRKRRREASKEARRLGSLK